jgi:hypothetical protein
MLATLGTYLARATRSKRPLLFAGAVQFDVAESVIRAAERNKVPVGLILDVQALISPVLAIAHSASVPVIVMARVEMAREAEKACELGVGGLLYAPSDSPSHTSLNTMIERAAAFGTDISLETDTDADLSGLGIVALFVREKVTPKGVAELKKNVRIPVVRAIDDLTPLNVRQGLAAGSAGIWLRDGVEEAYLAGLRTGLRNRAAVRAHHYLPYAVTAAEHAVSDAITAYVSKK